MYINSLPGNKRLCFPSRTLVYQRCWSTGTYINGYLLRTIKLEVCLYISLSNLRIIGYLFLLVLWYIKGVGVQEPI